MRRGVAWIAAVTCLASASARADSTGYLDEARTRGRPAVLWFSSPSCVSCARFERALLLDPEVIAALGAVVFVPVDVDTSAGEELAARYAVGSIPTLLILDFEGAPLDVLGAWGLPARPEQLLQLIDLSLGRGVNWSEVRAGYASVEPAPSERWPSAPAARRARAIADPGEAAGEDSEWPAADDRYAAAAHRSEDAYEALPIEVAVFGRLERGWVDRDAIGARGLLPLVRRGVELRPVVAFDADVGLVERQRLCYEVTAKIGAATRNGPMAVGFYAGVGISSAGPALPRSWQFPIELAVSGDVWSARLTGWLSTSWLVTERRRQGSENAPRWADELGGGLAAAVPVFGAPGYVGVGYREAMGGQSVSVVVGASLVRR